MTLFRSLLPALFASIITSACAQQTAFTLNGTAFIADNSFYAYGNVIRCERKVSAEEMPAAICCQYNPNHPARYFYAGENYTCPRIDGAIGTLSHRCSLHKNELHQSQNYANQGVTVEAMTNYCRRQ